MSGDGGRLLARGGRALGIAAIAHARGQRAGEGPWHALSAEMAAAAEQVLGALEGAVPPDALASAIGAAMGDAPPTAEPAWIRSLVSSPGAFETIGREGRSAWPEGFPLEPPEGDRERGLAIVALALCRSIDAARSLGAKLSPQDGAALEDWARLMQAVARPGEPSAVRDALRRIAVEGEGSWGT